MDGRDAWEEGQYGAVLETGLGLEGLERHSAPISVALKPLLIILLRQSRLSRSATTNFHILPFWAI